MWTVKYGPHSMCAHTHVLITTIRLYFYEFTFLKTSHVWGDYAEFAFSVLHISFSAIQDHSRCLKSFPIAVYGSFTVSSWMDTQGELMP